MACSTCGYEGAEYHDDPMDCVDVLRAEIERHRQFIERLTDGGTDYGEEWEDLLAAGLIVEVKPTPEYIEEWGDDCEMWVLAWKAHGFEEVE